MQGDVEEAQPRKNNTVELVPPDSTASYRVA